MSGSYSISTTFTQTNAKYLASKVASDLQQCHRLYGDPTASAVVNYEAELVAMLAGGYVEEYEFGYKKGGLRVVSWQYRVNASGDLVGGADDRSGGIYARADVAGATYFNFMSYSTRWFALSASERDGVRASHSISRSTGELPTDGNGYWKSDRTYSNTGVAVERRTFQPL